jgi:hypothetical protein
MPSLTDLLDDAVGPVVPGFHPADVLARAGRRRRSARVRRALGAAVVVVLVAGGGLLLARGGDRPRVTTPATTRSGVFPDHTGTVLAFDDGIDGVTLVDLDHRIAVRRVLPGQRAGDQPYRLTRAGNSLIVGWNDVYAAPLDGGRSRRLGHATYSVPADGPGRVWLVDWSGSAIGVGTSTLREVDLAGHVLAQGAGPDASTGTVASGVPGGVALETRSGVAYWNVDQRVITGRDGSGPAFVSDARAGRIVWCEGPCSSLVVHEFGGTPPFVVIPAPSLLKAFDARNARLSPDGTLLAASGGGDIVVFDTRTGRQQVAIGTFTGSSQPSLRWSADGRRLFFNSDSYMKDTTEIGEFIVATTTVHVATVPFGGLESGVALSQRDARALLRAPLARASTCTPPLVEPSRRTRPCGFRF